MSAITYQEFCTRLAFGQLRSLSIRDESNPSLITNKYRDQILSFTNQGLTNLSSRFVIMKKEVLVKTQAEVKNYYLRSDFTLSSLSLEVYKYLDDTLESFNEDVIKVLSVYDEDNIEASMNDQDNEDSIHNVIFDCLKIPECFVDQTLRVVYQARHEILEEESKTIVIRLPYYLEDALAHFVASKVFLGMGSPEQIAKGTMHLQMYDALCKEVMDSDFVSTSTSNQGTKLYNRGFV